MSLRLTADLCRSVARLVDDPGPEANLPYLTEEEYTDAVDEALAWFPERVAIFGYGSLIWRPPVAFEDRRPARLDGWQRSFCLKTTRWRGTAAEPGLMMALEPGGRCDGMLLTLPRGEEVAALSAIFRREIGVKPLNHDARLVQVKTAEGPVDALTFTASPAGRSYWGGLSQHQQAEVLARAVGVWGSCADYLRETVEALGAAGLHDPSLWRLQEAVAEILVRRIDEERRIASVG